MALPEPAQRELIHERHVHCHGYRRADGLWDIEGHLTDTKTYDFENQDRGTVEAGTPVHDMWIRLTIDDRFLVRDVIAVTDRGPFRVCADITPNFQRLKGLKIGPGWSRNVRRLLGGTEGCTHLVELLGPMATTAFQTIFPLRQREAESKRTPGRKPRLLNTCHVFKSDGETVRKHWPEFYTG
ncbi:MAG: DUF2889 domain-containing protein [Alphaproteobacteria bacterium]